jgi:hypothetical protein
MKAFNLCLSCVVVNESRIDVFLYLYNPLQTCVWLTNYKSDDDQTKSLQRFISARVIVVSTVMRYRIIRLLARALTNRVMTKHNMYILIHQIFYRYLCYLYAAVSCRRLFEKTIDIKTLLFT